MFVSSSRDVNFLCGTSSISKSSENGCTQPNQLEHDWKPIQTTQIIMRLQGITGLTWAVLGAPSSPPSVCQAVATQRQEPKHMELSMAGGQALSLSLCLSLHSTLNLEFDFNSLLLSHLLTGHVLAPTNHLGSSLNQHFSSLFIHELVTSLSCSGPALYSIATCDLWISDSNNQSTWQALLLQKPTSMKSWRRLVSILLFILKYLDANIEQEPVPSASSERSNASQMVLWVLVLFSNIARLIQCDIDPLPQGNQLHQDVAKGTRAIDRRIQHPQLASSPQHRRLLPSRTFEGIARLVLVHGILWRRWPRNGHQEPEKHQQICGGGLCLARSGSIGDGPVSLPLWYWCATCGIKSLWSATASPQGQTGTDHDSAPWPETRKQ